MKEFITEREENFKSKWFKYIFNLYPAYRRSSGRISFISSDWQEIHVRIKLGFRNWNINKSVFGGSIYASIDPIYAFQLMKIFGMSYVIWDKEAHIVFKKPIKKKVVAKFIIENDMINEIRKNLEKFGYYYLSLPVQFVDNSNVIHMEANKVVYIATKEAYAEKLRIKKQALNV